MNENYLSHDQLRRLLCDAKVTVTLAFSSGTVEIQPQLSFYFSICLPSCEMKLSGFEARTVEGEGIKEGEGEPEKKVQTFSDYDALLGYLKGLGCFSSDRLKLINIAGRYKSLESYERKLAFDNIDMAGLLQKYVPLADSFSLTCRFNDGYDAEHPFGLYRIEKADGERALEVLEKHFRDSAFAQYGRLSEEERKTLPPFEELYEEIREECRLFRKEQKRNVEKNGGEAFFGDTFCDNRKYGQYDELWGVYHNVDFYERSKYVIEKSYNLPLTRDVCAPLEGEEYRVLKKNLLRHEVTFCWHCTVSGMPHTVFYFALNEQTIAWLAQFEHDYQFSKLEDLAFYKGDKLLFSSCTHEGFHTDLSEKD